ncbi:hypothetical protein D3C80_660010 [compost metagenome]
MPNASCMARSKPIWLTKTKRPPVFRSVLSIGTTILVATWRRPGKASVSLRRSRCLMIRQRFSAGLRNMGRSAQSSVSPCSS